MDKYNKYIMQNILRIQRPQQLTIDAQCTIFMNAKQEMF